MKPGSGLDLLGFGLACIGLAVFLGITVEYRYQILDWLGWL